MRHFLNKVTAALRHVQLSLLCAFCTGTLLGIGIGLFIVHIPQQTTSVVIITDKEFLPHILTISPGDTVTFINRSKRVSWPASDPHPTHTFYKARGTNETCSDSAFDPCQPIPIGGVWSIRIDTPGNVSYHDHLKPSLSGTLEVTEEGLWKKLTQIFSAIFSNRRGIADIESFRNASASERKEYIADFAGKNPAGAWEFLKAAALGAEGVAFNAHDMAHIIGNALFVRYGADGVLKCDEAFSYGCIHGVSETLLSESGIDAIATVADSCMKLIGSTEDKKTPFGCIHGIGHGIAAWAAYDLPSAFEKCALLPENVWPYCYDGIFMETFSGSSERKVNEENPWEFCTRLGEEYLHNCARYIQIVFNESYVNNFARIASLCLAGPKQDAIDTCLYGLGFKAAQISVGAFETITAYCGEITDRHAHALCITGAARDTLFQNYTHAEATASSLCETLPDEEGVACIRYLKKNE